MSKILSENFYGKVVKYDNNFSIKVKSRLFEKYLIESGLEFEKETSKSGTIYYEIAIRDMAQSVRLSNHSKRGQDKYEVDFFNKKAIEDILNNRNKNIATYSIHSCETYDELVSAINGLKE